jgi:hypothetical protein
MRILLLLAISAGAPRHIELGTRPGRAPPLYAAPKMINDARPGR